MVALRERVRSNPEALSVNGSETTDHSQRAYKGYRGKVLLRQFLRNNQIVPPKDIKELAQALGDNPAISRISRGNTRVYIDTASPEAERVLYDARNQLSSAKIEQAYQQLQQEAQAYYRSHGVPEEAIPGLIDRLRIAQKDTIESSFRFSRRSIKRELAVYRQTHKKFTRAEIEQQKAASFEKRDAQRQQEKESQPPMNRVAIANLAPINQWLLRQVLMERSYEAIAIADPRKRNPVTLRKTAQRIFDVVAPQRAKSHGGRPSNEERKPLLEKTPTQTPDTEVSLVSLWQKGLLTDRELEMATMSLQAFLHKNHIKVITKDFPYVWAYFGDIEGVFLQHGSDHTTYRADEQVMQNHLQEIRMLAVALQERRFPKRTKEEKEYFRSKVLRVNNRGGKSSRFISIDTANQELYTLALRKFQQFGFGEESKTLAQETVNRAQPYLDGRRGNFPNFTHFRLRTFLTIVDNLKIERFRQSKKQRTRKEKVPKRKPPLQPETIPQFSNLDEDLKQIVLLRAKNIDWAHIATNVYHNKSGAAVAKTRKKYSRLRQSLPTQV